jgi:hypothetical protein
MIYIILSWIKAKQQAVLLFALDSLINFNDLSCYTDA